jgi:hypothetical protein
MHQERLLAADSRLPLPAPLALSLLNASAQFRTHLMWTPPSRHLIARFRALLAVCTNYAFFLQSGIWSPLLNPGYDCRPTIRTNLDVHPKSERRPATQRDKPILAIRVTANPTLVDLLEWYCTQRAAYCEKFYNTSPCRTEEHRTLRERRRLASSCYSLRLAPRRLHRHRRRTSKRLQMDIAQPPQRCRLRC